MTFKKSDFPVQSRPVYAFSVKDGELAVEQHQTYQVLDHGTLRIHTGSNIINKAPGQLDRVLNNHYWSMDPDARKAMDALLSRAEADLIAARSAHEAARSIWEDAVKADQALRSQNGG